MSFTPFTIPMPLETRMFDCPQAHITPHSINKAGLRMFFFNELVIVLKFPGRKCRRYQN
jgi:hypothetical protein